MSTSNNHNPNQQPPSHPDQNEAPSHTQDDAQSQSNPQRGGKKAKLPIHTHHCRFCNHLLLATTLQSLASLPTRKPPAKDGAVIVPLSLPASSSSATSSTSSSTTRGDTDTELKDREEGKKDLHTTILLSTTQPDRGFTVIRREDGFEKRRLIRCGRCRVVVGYFLDAVHFPSSGGGVKGEGDTEGDVGEEDEEKKDEIKVVYLLPAALMETGTMVTGDEEELRRLDRGWSSWV
ncbi:uncharacterized protein BDW47DRAFT_98679 [Aspergillus candidus]|uniref:STEEP1 domain-containing protein n=1 Tax=Aspergillus candidus TaxID=41067 RepID=A0A2I2FMI8_ASPCN|nr:hypothetical protein BDW47DRAFT_98679 [Aspergillus candidus]PLB41850.1 hypothetical protein BDW47DRAFT_98679 [Aspergillus candidus]